MKLLALDSSGMVASVALLTENSVVAEYSINYKKTHSQTLMPMVDEIVRMTECSLDTLDYVAVAGGPGSFTGLRIGSATAKGLGLALDIPVVSVPTLEGLAMNVQETEDFICPVMDARRNQVYTGIYHYESQLLKVDMDQTPMDIHDLLGRLTAYGKPVLFLGDGAAVYHEVISRSLVMARFALPHQNRQRAASVGIRAWELIREGRVESAADHKPVYLRLSQAERERMEHAKHSGEEKND